MNRNKMKRQAKEILKKKDVVIDSDGNALISVKAETREQIFSSFDFDSNEKLNPELAEYLSDRSEHVPSKAEIRVKFYTSEKIEQSEVEQAVHKNFEREFLNERAESRANWILIFVMTVLGLLSLTMLFLAYQYFDYVYITTILEIATWVFFWEALDAFVLERTRIQRRRWQVLKLCTCKVEVVCGQRTFKKRSLKEKESDNKSDICSENLSEKAKSKK